MPFDPSTAQLFDPTTAKLYEPESTAPKPGYEPYKPSMADVGISGGEFENVQPVVLPPFGEPGTFTRGVSKSLTGATEFATSTPGVALAPAMMIPGVGSALALGMSGMALYGAGKKGYEAYQTGSREAAGEAAVGGGLGILGTLGGVKGAMEFLPRATKEVIAPSAATEQPLPPPEFQFAKERWLGPERQLVGPAIRLPETTAKLETTAPEMRPELRAELAAELGPEMASAEPRPGDRISVPVESETAKKARKVWSKPVDPEAQLEGAGALRQIVSLTEERKTAGEPYKPPTVNVDLRQLERLMQRNTISKVESWADRVIQDKLRETGANPFLDPEFMAAAMTKGAILFKRGVTTFAEWSAEMKNQFGRGLDAALPGIFEQSKNYWQTRAAETKAAPAAAATTGAPSASQIQTPTTIHGNVRPQPIQGAGQVPIQESGAGVQPQAQGRIPQTQTQAEPAVAPVTPETAATPPVTKDSTGATTPPPPGSALNASNIPPEDPHWTVQANRVAQSFRDWWERFWPRSWAAMREHPDTPVITEHQRFLFSPLEFMQRFSQSKWWRALDNWDDSWLVQFEHEARQKYHERIAAGDGEEQAILAAMDSVPESLRAVFAESMARYPIEVQAANELGVEPPGKIEGPYLPRRTTEESKNVIDVPAGGGIWGGMLRKTLGSFARSRVHDTMKEGISAGTSYEPVRQAVWMRNLYSQQLEATARFVRAMKEKGVLYDTKEAAKTAGGEADPYLIRGLGGKDFYARSRQEGRFIEQNFDVRGHSPLAQVYRLANTYGRNPNLINPLPHTTKNMFFKYVLSRVGNFTFRRDAAEFKAATPSELLKRFNEVMPISETGERLPNLTAKEVGTWGEKVTSQGLGLNDWSSKFIFGKADPAMRYALWKSYVRKGMSDQAAANNVWLDLIRYDENSGGINFWKAMPFNFFVPWRLGTYVTLAKAVRNHPVRALAFIGAVEYMREMRYRKSGRWTHLPVDYIDAPLSEAINKPSTAPAVAATTLLFGPGGGQAPTTIRDLMGSIHGDPGTRSRVLNMFWGLSQIYEIPKDFTAYMKDGDESHLVNILTSAALSEHSALKYEPRRLMKWLPEWMPGLQKSDLVRQAEVLRARIEKRQEKSQATFERRHGVSASFERSPEEKQMQELRRAAH